MTGALLALVLATSADQGTWTVSDTVLQGVFVAVAATDYLQTHSFLRYDPNAYETNPLLGRHPDEFKLAAFVGGGVIAHTAIAYALPKPWRTLWQLAWITIEGGVVYGNIQFGTGFRW